ncbi:MAG: purine-nucleoside phosphorylase, partial [Fuerstia sp.]|nr:purine-nucleoside phosphorylase [Fuerstiella sp.]
MHTKMTHAQSQSDACYDARAVADAAKYVLERLPILDDDRPVIGVILGSGLGSAADRLLAAEGKSLAYTAIPGMPMTHVVGHAGRLVLGRIDGISVAMLQGRVHYYEGHSIAAIEFGTRLLHALGVRTLILTNAAGGIRTGFQPGNLMVISSHLRPLATDCVSRHPELRNVESAVNSGFADARISGMPFMQELLWSEELRHQAHRVKSPLQIHEGVYAM